MSERLDVAIVGAGPYGLSIAAHLNRLGASHRVYGEPMLTWRDHMPRGMVLKSDPFASCLYDPASRFTLEAFCRERGEPYSRTGWQVPLDLFVEYGGWFQARAAPALDPRTVTQIEKAGGEFGLTLDDAGAVRAKRVVICAGISHFARLPPQVRGLPGHLVSHSSEHADPGRFHGGHVTVLGAGASAVDLAMLMHEAGVNVRVVARSPSIRFGSGGVARPSLLDHVRRPRSGLGAGWSTYMLAHHPGPFRYLPDATRTWAVRRVLGPAAGWGVRSRIEGKVPFLLSHRLDGLEVAGDRLVMRLHGPGGPAELRTDHLVCATGYTADVAKLAFLSADLQRQIRLVDGSPRLDGAFQSSVRSLYFAGLAAANTFGPLQRFAFGARFAASRISRALA